jgi:hypothetical protein
MKLACLASLYQLNGILEGYKPVKAMPKGITDQHAWQSMVIALTSMDLCEQLIVIFLGYAPH